MTAEIFTKWNRDFSKNINGPQIITELLVAFLPNIIHDLGKQAEENGIDSTPCWELLGNLYHLIDNFQKGNVSPMLEHLSAVQNLADAITTHVVNV